MVEEVSTSEMSVYYETTRRNVPERSNLHTRRRENLKSHKLPCISCHITMFPLLIPLCQCLNTVQKGKSVPLHAMEELGGERRYSSYSFSTSALDGVEWSASRPGSAFTPGERTPGTQCTGGWVGPRAGLDTEARGKTLCPRRGSNPDRPVVQPVVRHYTAELTRLLTTVYQH
jgi:hypothetical protein